MVEYLSGNRIQGSSTADATATYTPDMTSDTNWLDTVSDRIDNNTSTGKIDFDVHRTDTNQALSYDLGTALSNTAWTLRYKMTVDTITQVSDANRMFMGMRSISASSNASTNSDFIGWHSKVGRTGGGVDFKEFNKDTKYTLFSDDIEFIYGYRRNNIKCCTNNNNILYYNN